MVTAHEKIIAMILQIFGVGGIVIICAFLYSVQDVNNGKFNLPVVGLMSSIPFIWIGISGILLRNGNRVGRFFSTVTPVIPLVLGYWLTLTFQYGWVFLVISMAFTFYVLNHLLFVPMRKKSVETNSATQKTQRDLPPKLKVEFHVFVEKYRVPSLMGRTWGILVSFLSHFCYFFGCTWIFCAFYMLPFLMEQGYFGKVDSGRAFQATVGSVIMLGGAWVMRYVGYRITSLDLIQKFGDDGFLPTLLERSVFFDQSMRFTRFYLIFTGFVFLLVLMTRPVTLPLCLIAAFGLSFLPLMYWFYTKRNDSFFLFVKVLTTLEAESQS